VLECPQVLFLNGERLALKFRDLADMLAIPQVSEDCYASWQELGQGTVLFCSGVADVCASRGTTDDATRCRCMPCLACEVCLACYVNIHLAG
jgi:hypothetical protein